MDQENQVLFDVAAIKDSVSVASRPEPEVIAVAQRRRFSMSFKRRVVRAADACKEPGEVGALLRRERLYSSHLCQWRKEVTAVEERALRPPPRGPSPMC